MIKQGYGKGREEMRNLIEEYPQTSNILNDIKKIIETSQHRAYQAVDAFLVQRN